MLSLGSAWVPGANQRILMPVICTSPKTTVLQSSRELGAFCRPLSSLAMSQYLSYLNSLCRGSKLGIVTAPLLGVVIRML